MNYSETIWKLKCLLYKLIDYEENHFYIFDSYCLLEL
jgi:hypothetical protein